MKKIFALFMALALAVCGLDAKEVKNFKCSDGWKYTGSMVDGKRHGQGKAVSPKGNVYEGKWVKNKLPYGTMKTTAGAEYEGPFDSKMYACGYGKMKYTEGDDAGSIYIGNFASGMRNGLGAYTDKNGEMSFGIWKAGKLQKMEGQNFKPGEQAYGIDISHFNSDIDWDNLALYANADGDVYKSSPGKGKYLQPVSWVYARATEGATEVDRLYAKHMANAKKHFLPRGSYHFMKYTTSKVEDQVQNFLKASNYCKGDELPPMLDLECETAKDVGRQEATRMVKKWLKEVEKATGMKPIIYFRDSYADKYLDLSQLKGYTMWKSSYGANSKSPKVAPRQPYDIWQFTQWGRPRGVKGNIDIDIYDGAVKDFSKKFVRNPSKKK